MKMLKVYELARHSLDYESAGKTGQKMPGLTTILCLTSRTTVTSAHILEGEACHRARNLCFLMRSKRNTRIDA